jgi:hypothetical protein
MMTSYQMPALPRELTTPGPHPGLRDALGLFGQFVGDWKMRVRFFDSDGATVYDQPGTWSFGWILDGRCVQDVLIYPNSRTGDTEPGRRGIGTTVRHYDATADAWNVVWFGAVTGTLIRLAGRAAGDEIVLEGDDVDGSPLRWVFSEITPASFRWQGFIADTADRWRMEQQMFGERVGTPGRAS